MKSSRCVVMLTSANLVLLVWLLAQSFLPAAANAQPAARAQVAEGAPPVLRAGGLEIVDAQGRVRALLAIQPPATVDGRDYPETVLLRLVNPESGPVVKLTAARNGSALTLSDDAEGGVALFARDTGSFVRVRDSNGQEAALKP